MIYLDNAATTRMYEECLDAYKNYGVDLFYNPSALYTKALDSYNVVNKARATIAQTIGCNSSEIIFTASGSEADNIALRCSIKYKKGRVIVSSVEHAAINNTALYLKNKGFDVVFASTDRFGRVDLDNFKSLLTSDTVLVSIMHVCNETGACNDIKTIVSLAKQANSECIVHSDGVQAYGKIPVNVMSLGVDLYSMSAHKIHGPKGMGALFVKNNTNLRTFIYGGGQEFNIRSATENVASIAAFEIAARKTKDNLMKNYTYLRSLQKLTISLIEKNFNSEDISINTDVNNSGPHVVSIAFRNCRGEGILHYMEMNGVIIGTGSACSAKKSLKRIPKALNLDSSFYDGMIRLSFNESNTAQEIENTIELLVKALEVEKKLHN